jgi:hypothetical protein
MLKYVTWPWYLEGTCLSGNDYSSVLNQYVSGTKSDNNFHLNFSAHISKIFRAFENRFEHNTATIALGLRALYATSSADTRLHGVTSQPPPWDRQIHSLKADVETPGWRARRSQNPKFYFEEGAKTKTQTYIYESVFAARCSYQRWIKLLILYKSYYETYKNVHKFTCGSVWVLNVVSMLRKENRQKVFENRLLKRILGPKRDEVTGGWWKLLYEQLHNLYPSPSIINK